MSDTRDVIHRLLVTDDDGEQGTFDVVDDFLSDHIEHHGVKGMKWGVRKDRRGENQKRFIDDDGYIKEKTLAPKRLLVSPKTALVFTQTYLPVRKAIKKEIALVNEAYRGFDFTKPSKIRDEYYAESIKAINTLMNASSSKNKQSFKMTAPILAGLTGVQAAMGNIPSALITGGATAQAAYLSNKSASFRWDPGREDEPTIVLGYTSLTQAPSLSTYKWQSKDLSARKKTAKTGYAELQKQKKATLEHSDGLVEDGETIYLACPGTFQFSNDGYILDLLVSAKNVYLDTEPTMAHADSLTAVDDFLNDHLEHHGVKGMKWGVRKPRSSSGASPASRASGPRTRKVQKTRSPSYKKPAKTDLLSNDELRRSNERLRLEKEYNTLISEVKRQNRSKGQKFLQDTVMKIGQDIVKDVVKSQITNAIKKQKSSGGGKKSISHEEPTNKSKKKAGRSKASNSSNTSTFPTFKQTATSNTSTLPTFKQTAKPSRSSGGSRNSDIVMKTITSAGNEDKYPRFKQRATD